MRLMSSEIIDLRKLCRLGFSVELALIEMTLARLFKILDKVVHWTTPYPVDSYPVDTIGCSKAWTVIGWLSSFCPMDKMLSSGQLPGFIGIIALPVNQLPWRPKDLLILAKQNRHY